MKHIKYQGRSVDAQELDVVSSNERWNEYQLADGTELAIKLVLVKVFRAVNEKSSEGEPLYMVNSQNIVKVKTVEKDNG